MDQILEKLKNKKDLTFEESKTAFEILMTGKASDDEIFNFLTLLSEKGEVSDEIAGGVFVLREKSKRVNVSDCIDTCGTGGDGMNTLNISTASALLLSSIGTKVAKHGNKAVSSKCGSGDVLEALKIKIDLEPENIEKEWEEDYKDHHPSHGHINFTYGTHTQYNISSIMIKPQVGDFYIFPASLYHCVYPFYTTGERRSFSINMTVM